MTIRYGLRTTTFFLSLGMTVLLLQPACAEDDMGTLPSPTGNSQVFVPATPISSSMPSAMPAGGAPSALPGTAPTVPGTIPGAVPTPGLLESPQTPKIVNDAVTGLQKTDPINLDDMIRAQDAINRLDLMLEIEKRQTELKKIRDERNKPVGFGPGAIPASALNLPPMMGQPQRAMRAPSDDEDDMPGSPSSSSSSSGGIDKYSIKRIIGTDGRYSAVLSSGDKVESVVVGDTLAGDVKVKSIKLTSVTLSKGKKTKTLTIPSDAYIVRESAGAIK